MLFTKVTFFLFNCDTLEGTELNGRVKNICLKQQQAYSHKMSLNAA